MKKIALLVVLSLGFFGCVRHQIAQPVQPVEEVRFETIVNEEAGGRIIEIDVFINNVYTMAYEYFGGDMREELGEMRGVPLRARVSIPYEGIVVTYYFNDDNIIVGYMVFGDEILLMDCDYSAETLERCRVAQERWIPVYVRFEFERRVAEALGR
jgi:hypothetical protein